MDSIDGKVLVIGASGKVGQNVVKELRAHEIPVRVLVRNLDDRVASPPLLSSDVGIEIVQGDVTDSDAVCKVAEGVVAVIDVHGVAPLRLSRISDLWRDPHADLSHPAAVNFGGVRNVVEACQKHGVKHLVRLTGLAVSMPASNPLVMLINLFLSFSTKWHRRSEMFIRNSGLSYTIVQPFVLKDTPKAAEVGGALLLQCEATSVKPTLPPRGISRLDVASLCVEALLYKSCKNATLRCVSLPEGSPVPVGVQNSKEWKNLLKNVIADGALLEDQNYVLYSMVGISVFASIFAGVFFGAGKLAFIAARAAQTRH